MPEQENFDELRQLLALKRFEQPPPGYFDRLSRSIAVHLESQNRPAESFKERLFQEAPWLEQLWGNFERRPFFASACTVAFCGLVASIALLSDAPSAQNLGTFSGASISAAAPWVDNNSSVGLTKATFVDFSTSNSVPSPALKGASLFDEMRTLHNLPTRSEPAAWGN